MNLGILEEEVLNLQSIIIRNWRPFVKSQGCVCVCVWVYHYQYLCCIVYTPSYHIYVRIKEVSPLVCSMWLVLSLSNSARPFMIGLCWGVDLFSLRAMVNPRSAYCNTWRMVAGRTWCTWFLYRKPSLKKAFNFTNDIIFIYFSVPPIGHWLNIIESTHGCSPHTK